MNSATEIKEGKDKHCYSSLACVRGMYVSVCAQLCWELAHFCIFCVVRLQCCFFSATHTCASIPFYSSAEAWLTAAVCKGILVVNRTNFYTRLTPSSDRLRLRRIGLLVSISQSPLCRSRWAHPWNRLLCFTGIWVGSNADWCVLVCRG